jgi:hypothetical protein
MGREQRERETDPWKDRVVEAYKPGVDVTLLVEQLRRTPEERMKRVEDMQHAVLELQRAARVPAR